MKKRPKKSTRALAEELKAAAAMRKQWTESHNAAVCRQVKEVRDPIGEVVNERKRQDEKWGEQNHPPGKWFMILGEECGEACKAALEGDWDGYRHELIQVAAVAVAMVECHDRNP